MISRFAAVAMTIMILSFTLGCAHNKGTSNDDVPEMNGIKLHQFGDYPKKWKLITVRYRKDSNEMRFTYANPIAAKAMEEGQLPYPEGSVFAKIGFITGIDPAFESSVVPNGSRRFQFMVKDSKKYPETTGWGYALFQSDGKLFPDDVKTKTASCHACHQIVPEKDYVFSEYLEVSPFKKSVPMTYSLQKNVGHIAFADLARNEFSGAIVKYMTSNGWRNLRVLQGSMREHFFGGTLDEVTPILIRQVLDNKFTPSAFVSANGDTFKVVRKSNAICKSGEVALAVAERREVWPDNSGEKGTIRNKELCYTP